MTEVKKPVWGKNIKPGYIGFTFTDDSFISDGIAWFTRQKDLDIKVSHTFVVGYRPMGLIEAHVETGVRAWSIEDYINDPKTHLFFRKPKGLTDTMTQLIIDTAEVRIGAKYDKSLILGHMLSNTFLGRLLVRMIGNIPEKILTAATNNPEEWICSELVANCLDSCSALHDVGILAEPVSTITPQELFEDQEIFEPFKMEVGS